MRYLILSFMLLSSQAVAVPVSDIHNWSDDEQAAYYVGAIDALGLEKSEEWQLCVKAFVRSGFLRAVIDMTIEQNPDLLGNSGARLVGAAIKDMCPMN